MINHNNQLLLTPSLGGAIRIAENYAEEAGVGFDVFNSRSSKIVVDEENNIHVVGPFTTYSGSTVNGYVKLLPNGTLDPDYDGTVSGSGVGIYTPNFANKDAYTIELINV